MGTIITDLKEAFRRGNIYIQLIYINVAVFVVTTLTEVILQLFNRSLGGVFEWLELPASLTQFIIQPWSLFTYMFMHAGFLHILFNMLWLYWFGALFLMFFSAKHLRGAYILFAVDYCTWQPLISSRISARWSIIHSCWGHPLPCLLS